MSSNRKHDFDQKFFEKIDTEEKAYILGFIYADGCNSLHPTTGCLSIAQMEKDVDILEKIKLAMKSTSQLKKKKTNGEVLKKDLHFMCMAIKLRDN